MHAVSGRCDILVSPRFFSKIYSPSKTWSYIAGEKGWNRVRVYEDGPGGKLPLEYFEDGDSAYRAMLMVAGEVDWRCHVALVLAHETGHRIGAIRKLKRGESRRAVGQPTVR